MMVFTACYVTNIKMHTWQHCWASQRQGIVLYLQVWCVNLGCGPVSPAPAVMCSIQDYLLDSQLVQQNPKPSPQGLSAVVCCNDGTVAVLQHQHQPQQLGRQQPNAQQSNRAKAAETSRTLHDQAQLSAPVVAARVVLPAQVFSSPVTIDDYVMVGCRDDHLYCLHTNVRASCG